MNRGSTLFLKIAVILIGLPVLAACIFLVPGLSRLIPAMMIARPILQIIFITDVYLSALVFFQALLQAWRLLGLIDRNEAFSLASVRALKNIKLSAAIIGGLYIVQLPLIYIMAESDDAPGLIVLGMIIVFASLVIAVFAAVLQRLLQDAIDLKSEVDLTV